MYNSTLINFSLLHTIYLWIEEPPGFSIQLIVVLLQEKKSVQD